MTTNRCNERGHALVIGGSMAGLLAARVLADHYQQVTVIERDNLPFARENRRGVPQGRHTHGLLASGREALEALFPGLGAQLVAEGAVAGDSVYQGRWYMEGGCHVQIPSGFTELMMSRPFLEGAVRERVRGIGNVQLREAAEVTGLIPSADKRRVAGVETKGESLTTDLVVDTAGRGSHTPEWLEAMGYARPPEERVEIALGYTTRCFRRDPEGATKEILVVIPATPDGKRGGVMLAQEDNRWTVTLTSYFGPKAPEELEGFLEFAASLPAPYIYETIRRAAPVGQASSAQFPASVRRRYEQLRHFPAGFLVMGDAISSFNPAYGQGMSVAALEATELRALLAGDQNQLARRFFARAAKVVDIPWSITVGNDLRIPETRGARTLATRLINAYISRLHRAAQHDPEVALAFHRVGKLLAPPASIMHPRIARRVLWGKSAQNAKKPPVLMEQEVNQ